MKTIKKTFVSANILKLELTHNGYMGGDSGHGGFVNIKLIDEANTEMYLNGELIDSIEIEFRGDCERDTLVGALEAIILELGKSRLDTTQIYNVTNQYGGNLKN